LEVFSLATAVLVEDIARHAQAETVQAEVLDQALEEILTLDLARSRGFSGKRVLLERMVEKVDRVIGRYDLTEKLRQCHEPGYTTIELYAHQRHIETARCRMPKLCPFCARDEANRRKRVYAQAVLEATQVYRLQFLTLTIPNVTPENYAESVQGMFEAWFKLRRRKAWTDMVAGAILVLETTGNVEDGTLHPHFHVLLAVKSRREGDFDWGEVQAQWNALTGGQQVDFRPVTVKPTGTKALPEADAKKLDGMIAELLKYPAKFSDVVGTVTEADVTVDGNPDPDLGWTDAMFEAWFMTHCTAGGLSRTLRTYGIFNGLSGEDDEATEDENSAPDEEKEQEPLAIYRVEWKDGHAVAVTLKRTNNSTEILRAILATTTTNFRKQDKILRELAQKWCASSPDPEAWHTIYHQWCRLLHLGDSAKGEICLGC